MNKLYKALIFDNQVSLSVLDVTELVSSAIRIHSLDDNSARALGGLLTCAAYMAGCLKSDRGAVSLTVKGEDSATVSVSADKDLHVRGYIDGNSGKLKGGNMTVIKDDGFFRPYIGTTELVSEDISENLTQYFELSEQIKTLVKFGVKVENGKCLAAGGVVLQLLPGTSEENGKRAEEIANGITDVASVVEKGGAQAVLDKYFAAVSKDAQFYLSYPVYKCNCSREKITNVILPLGRNELLNIAREDGAVKVHCHYCNTDYAFDEKDILELFN